MKQKEIIFFILLAVFVLDLPGDFLHTVDGKIYEGKMVAFKFNTIYFNVYKFGKIHRTDRFPLYQIWKIEFNEPPKKGLESPFEIEQNYDRMRKGKRSKKVFLLGNQKWFDTGIDVNIGDEILFSASGSIRLDEKTSVFQGGEEYVNWKGDKPLPNQPTGAVIGRVGKNGELFYIGDDRAPFQMVEKGKLFIGINDFDCSNNSGQFIVTVYF